MNNQEFIDELYRYKHLFYEIKVKFIGNQHKNKDVKSFTGLIKGDFKKDIQESFNLITLEEGHQFLELALSKSMAYKSRLLDEIDAKRIAESFFSVFNDPLVFTNYTIKDTNISTSNIITDYTFECLVGCIDEEKAGYILIADED